MKHSYFYFKNVFSSSEIKTINAKFLSSNNYNTNPAPFDKKTIVVRYHNFSEVKDIIGKANECVDYANKYAFGFDLHPLLDMETILHNVYDSSVKASYDLHCDGEAYDKNFTTKLTGLVNLSEVDYEGGHFEIFDGSKIKTLKELNEPGDMVVIKSDIPHRVTQVTKGTRTSLVILRSGPWWR